MEMLKKQSIPGLVAYVIVAIMTLATLFAYTTNVNTAYYSDMNSNILIIMIVAFVCAIGAFVLPMFLQGKLFSAIKDVLRVAAAALVIWAGILFIGMRVESFGYTFGSNLELGNDAAFSAANQAITAIALFVITWFLALVASFLKVGNKTAKSV